ncbi:hypothetical protein WMZ97_21725 [Lentibacillus sp. N15]|uniref:hypothetical protein n=1 Tax=Lentibacillus songyuanensis TaxID=3136161 RepID=UPI0031BB36CE
MKKILLLSLLSFCALFLFACQEKEMTLLDDISSISISKSGGYGGVNDNYFTIIDQDTLTSRFQGILKNAEGKRKRVNVEKEMPDYDIVVDYKNGETHFLNLVVGSKGEKSRVMYVGHENNGFDISPEDTEKLREIIKGQ